MKGTSLSRRKLTIAGIVQGVGFRPEVYRIALAHQLSGYVCNHSDGVTIEVQGPASSINAFTDALRHSPPPLARIDRFDYEDVELRANCHKFVIEQTLAKKNAIVVVPTDKSCCADCLAEINQPDNRHFQYPFTNCTNCGPRYSLITNLPYDRPQTSLANFGLCMACHDSYHNPLDRRYHAQPVSCPTCGPHLTLLNADAQPIAEKTAALTECIGYIKQGKIVAIKGLGGFHLVCDASNHDAVEQLRIRKQRPSKPLAVMVPDASYAQQLVIGNQQEWQQLQSLERPIVLMRKNGDTTSLLSPLVAPDIDKLGVFLPYTPLHHLLLDGLGSAIVATSANLSGEPVIIDAKEIFSKLGHVVDYVLDHNREIINACDDSVVQLINDKPQVLRLARGYAPLSFAIDKPIKQTLLAVGAQQKNTLAFAFDHNIFVSPHIGDLFSVEAEVYFDNTIDTFKRLYRLQPNWVIHDKHPDYAPSKWSERLQQSQPSVKRLSLQHHYAHVLSVMAINQISTPVLGISFDGTGLGDDGSLWGGEALIADCHQYQHIAGLQPFKLIGAEQAIKDPRRVVIALLLSGRRSLDAQYQSLPCFNEYSPLLINNLCKLHQAASHGVMTSSMGRLFDAVACVLGLITTTQYEGQAGMLLEAAANQATQATPLTLNCSNGKWKSADLFQQIVKLLVSEPPSKQLTNNIAAGFMQAIGHAVLAIAQQHAHLPVALCGGVFQNRYLSEFTLTLLLQQQINVLDSGLIPVNDAGISLGQIWYGIHNHKITPE
ncbi:carbamoyltransferase HypF [Shewanella waksmanii]|uniref:carbamoyltransferase HypF n=1 Tax=Shewanella waksmanii TaxID=213783 RepID=UPI003736684B